jgi:hypothetical protein
LLLDDEFLNAYQHGMVIECCDGTTRRFYPRIFTYSADYKEKYVLPENKYINIELTLKTLQNSHGWD